MRTAATQEAGLIATVRKELAYAASVTRRMPRKEARCAGGGQCMLCQTGSLCSLNNSSAWLHGSSLTL